MLGGLQSLGEGGELNGDPDTYFPAHGGPSSNEVSNDADAIHADIADQGRQGYPKEVQRRTWDESFLGRESNGAVIITVVAMGVMQMAVHQIVHVVTVRHGFVAAARAVNVVCTMTLALMRGRATSRVGIRHLKRMLVHVVAMRVV